MTPARFPHSDTPGSQLGCQLPRAYRRLLRPSSALDAKASTMRPSQLVTTPTQHNQQPPAHTQLTPEADQPVTDHHPPALPESRTTGHTGRRDTHATKKHQPPHHNHSGGQSFIHTLQRPHTPPQPPNTSGVRPAMRVDARVHYSTHKQPAHQPLHPAHQHQTRRRRPREPHPPNSPQPATPPKQDNHTKGARETV